MPSIVTEPNRPGEHIASTAKRSTTVSHQFPVSPQPIYASSRPIWIILAITLLIAGCFVAMGLQQRQSRRETDTVPISQIRLGDRVPGENPEGDSREPEIEASQWRAVYIQATLEDGSLLELDLLRPVAWVRQHDLKVGHEVPVNFGETETKRGLGKVQRINPCPSLRAGPGHTVTGVFRHAVPEIVVVSTTNGEQIRATPEHPFWSETHSAFVPAKDLEPGSRLRHLTGETTVASVTPRPAQQTVYNLEVYGSHAFHVGQSGLLVHNCGNGIPSQLNVSGKQFGKKMAERARELGLDPGNPRVRYQMRSRIQRIFDNADEIRSGVFRGQGPNGSEGPVLFFRRGNDVVVTSMNGEFVTLLTGGINNKRFIEGVLVP